MSNNAWKPNEDKYLTEKFPSIDTLHIAQHLGRSYEGVRQRAKVLQIKKVNRYWTTEEVSLLIENYGKMEFRQLKKTLGKTKWAIHSKLRQIKNPPIEIGG